MSAPEQTSFDFGAALRRLAELRGSDLHLKVGNRPLIRVNGTLCRLDQNAPRLEPARTERLLEEILPEGRATEFQHHIAPRGRARRS